MTDGTAAVETPLRGGWLTPDEAVEQYVAYERRHRRADAALAPEGHARLARYAAFPFIVDAELVNLIRINFLDDTRIPWYAEADFLLSPLCRPVGDGLYRVDPAARDVMLVDFFEQEPDPGRTLLRLADFLLAFADSPLAARYPADVWGAWRWIALAYVQPAVVVREMGDYLKRLAAAGAGSRAAVAAQDQLHVSLILEMVRAPIERMLPPEEYADLLAAARVIADYWYAGAEPAAEAAPGSVTAAVVGLLRGVVAGAPPGVQPEIMESAQPPATAGARPRADFYAHIPLPAHYIPRPEVLAEVRAKLLAPDETIGRRWVTLTGVGGMGKSVLSRALCDDPEIQAAFPDGILWATLGQTPALPARLADQIHALGGVLTESTPTVEQLRANLAALVTNRACLLILDDVRSAEQVMPFTLFGPRYKLLLTTRDSALASVMGGRAYLIGGMDDEEAIALLEAWAEGALRDAPRETLHAIVERLGRLPLALRLAGAQLQQMVPDEWLTEFDKTWGELELVDRVRAVDLEAPAPNLISHPIDRSADDWARIQKALNSAFGSSDEMHRFFREHFRSLEQSISWFGPRAEITYDLIDLANRTGQISRLLTALAGERPDRGDLRTLANEFARRATNAAAISQQGDIPRTGAPPAARADQAEELTERERAVLALMAQGYSNRKIADRLNLSPTTVRLHASKILAKLGAANRDEAAAMVSDQSERADLRAVAAEVARAAARPQSPIAGQSFGPLPLVRMIPPPVPDFTGRQAELDQITDVLLRAQPPAVAIIGAGGIGKTELARAVAQRLTKVYPDQWMVALQPGGVALKPEELLARVIQAFRPERKLPNMLGELRMVYRQTLAGRRGLLLLDDAADREQVQLLLPPPKGWALLITSRRDIALDGAQTITLTGLPQDDSVALLRRYLGQVDAAEADLRNVADLSAGSPEALKIIADELVRIAPEARVLPDGTAALAAIRTLLGITLKQPSPRRRNALEIVVRRANAIPDLRMRAEALRLTGAAHRETGDLENAVLLLQLAVAAARTTNDFPLIARVAEALGDAASEGREGDLAVHAYEEALTANRAIADRLSEGAVLKKLGDLRRRMRQPNEALEAYEQSLSIAREIDDLNGERQLLVEIAATYDSMGDSSRAALYRRKSFDSGPQTNARRDEANTLLGRAREYVQAGRLQKAVDYLEESLQISREIGASWSRLEALGALGEAYSLLGDRERAIVAYEQAVEQSRKLGDKEGELRWSWDLAREYVRVDRVLRGLRLMQAVLSEERAAGLPQAEQHARELAEVGRQAEDSSGPRVGEE